MMSILKTDRLLDPSAGQADMRAGACLYPDVIADGVLDPVADEARRLFTTAEEVSVTEYQRDVGGQEMRSPMRFGSALAQDQLKGLHRHSQMVEIASAMMGRRMEPTDAGYVFYRGGDFIGIHRDYPACQFTMLASLFGDAPPLFVYPELIDTAPEALMELARESDGAPAGGRALELVPQGLIALSGIMAPHQTPPDGGSRPAAIATLCYREAV